MGSMGGGRSVSRPASWLTAQEVPGPTSNRYPRMQPRLSRMQPLWQERIGVHVLGRLEVHAVVAHELLQPPVIERIERFGASADVLVADEDLRDGRRFGPHFKNIADLATPIVLLVGG